MLWKRRRLSDWRNFFTETTGNDDEWDEILQRFQEEGLDQNLPEESKLLYVWRWLVDAETNCISLRHQLDKLSRRQSDELEEIRSCMEQMCNSWETKVLKLEEENKRFQEQLNLSGQNSGIIVSDEIRQMLRGEGLTDIISLSVVEQFAYLLDERTRLRSKLDQEITARRKYEQLVCMSSNLPDCIKLSSPYVQKILDRQKDEYEEEIRHQQEAMKHVKEQLKQVHEDELLRLKAENERLTTELSKNSQKLQELVTHVAKECQKDAGHLPWVQHILDGTHEKDLENLRKEVDLQREKCQEQQKQVREQAEIIRRLERSNKQMEIDNETLAYKLSESLAQFDELEDQLRKESSRARRDSFYNKLSIKENNSIHNNLNKMLDNRLSTQDPSMLVEMVKQLQEESSSLKEHLEMVQNQLQAMTIKYQQHKEKYREKMYRLRDLQEQEHREWKERFEGCEKELAVLQEMLQREQEWRLSLEADCHRLRSDNQMLKSGILEKEKTDHRDKPLDVFALQKEIEKLKSASRPSSASASPSRRSVWPISANAKKW